MALLGRHTGRRLGGRSGVWAHHGAPALRTPGHRHADVPPANREAGDVVVRKGCPRDPLASDTVLVDTLSHQLAH